MSGTTQPLVTDAVVVGAGPVGLFQVFQLGLLGLRAELVDVLPEAGGQCMALYPDKPIYDVPGMPRCTGRELAAQLLAQARPFMPPDPATGRPRNLHLRHQVETLTLIDPAVAGMGSGTASSAATGDRPRFALTTDRGLHLQAFAVFIAAGAGAFVPRAWPIPGLAADTPLANLHHDLGDASQAAPWAGGHVAVAGGGDEALEAVIDLVEAPPDRRPARVTLVHRRDQFQAEPALEAAVRALLAQGRVDLALGVPQGAVVVQHHGQPGCLQSVDLLGPDGHTRNVPLDHLIVRLGLSPRLGPLTQWGLTMDRKQLGVDAATFETAIPGIHAVGDINTYPGKKRLLLCGFHEATLAAYAAAARLRPDEPQHLQYTTTSTLLHRRLGLE